ncbi:hypothetical protein [Alkalihalobacterium elongatum]|uniref:hypothetical protein n=1 Tax=Alkalihalobacterium elongatum TaxID=2675466 RepID=UPI001C1F3451|nr:hypothetical protein [Alkalihalobacterium elongatum]
MIKKIFLIGTFTFITAIILFIFLDKKAAYLETLTFEPIDHKVEYINADTSLQFLTIEDEDEYTIEWNISSQLNQKAYLRKDISFLFEDGRLTEVLSKWDKNKQEMNIRKVINGEDSGHFQAVSFHHSEIHYPNDEIKSRLTISCDDLYVIDSPLAPIQSFKVPSNEKELEGKRILDYIVEQQLAYIWKDMLGEYNIVADNYMAFPLTSICNYKESPLPNMNEDQTTFVIHKIGESIYKEYFSGIQNEHNLGIKPVGSTVPLILLSNNNDHFIIMFQTLKGEKVQHMVTLPF